MKDSGTGEIYSSCDARLSLGVSACQGRR